MADFGTLVLNRFIFRTFEASGTSKDAVVVTPLMEYVRSRRAAKSTPQVVWQSFVKALDTARRDQRGQLDACGNASRTHCIVFVH